MIQINRKKKFDMNGQRVTKTKMFRNQRYNISKVAELLNG